MSEFPATRTSGDTPRDAGRPRPAAGGESGRVSQIQFRRRDLALLGALTMAGRALAACPPRAVLFVCPAGTVKSAIARELTKRRAAARGLAAHVSSRGVTPEDHVSPALAARLRADGLDPAAEPARALTPADLAGSDIVVAFDEAAKAPGMARARVWDMPSWNSSYDQAMLAVTFRIDALLDELAAAPCRQ
jgi:protein-tyrosine-phosphatase